MTKAGRRKRILIIKLGALGDMAQAVSAFEAIKNHHAGAHLTLLTKLAYAELPRQTNLFDDIWFDQRAKIHQLSNWCALFQRLKKAKFDRVYDLQLVDRTQMYACVLRFSLKQRPEWVGTSFLSSHKYKGPDIHGFYSQERFNRLLGSAGILDIPPLNLRKYIKKSHNFQLSDLYSILVPGASSWRDGAKIWPIEGYRALAAFLVGKGIQPVIIGGDQEDHSILKKTVPESLDLTGRTTLSDLVSIASKALVSVGNDTGPLHICGASGSPILGLFSGQHDPSVVGARGPRYEHIQQTPLSTLSVDSVLSRLQTFL